MTWLADLYFTHPFWIWLAVGGLFLAVEIATGTGWLLWSAGCAVVVALLSLILPVGPMVHLLIWAGLSIATTLTARRYLPSNISGDGPDINDNLARLIGHQGDVVEAFRNGQGRVFVDGKEWAAISDDGGAPKLNEKVQVVSAAGSVLHVKSA